MAGRNRDGYINGKSARFRIAEKIAAIARRKETAGAYVVAWNASNGRGAVHAASCSIARRQGDGLHRFPVHAPTAARAAEFFAQCEDLAARGYPVPTVCDCAK